jgi:hypothetical protein
LTMTTTLCEAQRLWSSAAATRAWQREQQSLQQRRRGPELWPSTTWNMWCQEQVGPARAERTEVGSCQLSVE